MTTPPPPPEPPAGTATQQRPVPEMGPSRRKRRRRRGLWLRRGFALLVLFALVACIGFGLVSLVRFLLPAAPLNLGGAAPGESLNVLVIGVDPAPVPQDDDDKTVRRLADTIQVLSLDYHHHRAFVLAIPRDTRATLGANGEGAVGDALALGGTMLVKDTVEQLTGLKIHHTIWLDMEGAKDAMKLVGPLDEYLPKPIKFADKNTGLSLDLPQGWHTLSGDQLLAYAFYREPGGDLDRLERQQMLIQQWQRQLQSPFTLLWFPSVASRAVTDMTTDLSKADFETVAAEWRKVDPRDLTFALLPGEVSPKGEWLMNPQLWDTVLPKLQAIPGTRSVLEAKPSIEILYKPDHTAPNGAKADEKVLELADTLSKQGFQVLRTTMQDVPQIETLIVDRTRAAERSEPVLQALDTALHGARVVVDPGEANGYGAQYSVQLGQSFFR